MRNAFVDAFCNEHGNVALTAEHVRSDDNLIALACDLALAQRTMNRELADMERHANRTGTQLGLRTSAPRSAQDFRSLAENRARLRDGTHPTLSPSTRLTSLVTVGY